MSSSTDLDIPHSVPLDTVRQALEKYSDNPSAFLALNSGNSYFTVPGHNGVIAYRRCGRYLVQFGGAFAPPADYGQLLGRFYEHARARRRKVVAVQLQPHDLEYYAELGFTINQVGASYAVDLATCTLRGSRFMQLRNKISRAGRAGLVVREVDQAEWADRMAALDTRWLRSKGKHAKPLEFLVGEYGGPVQPHRRLFVGTLGKELAGYISYSPVYGSQPGWLHDLSRRLPDGPPGVMEAINKAAIDTFQAEQVSWLHFGFTPFTGLDSALENSSHSRWFRWLVHQLGVRGESVYPAKTQLAYKEKWNPVVLPEYIAFSRRASVRGFLQVFRVSNAL
ncbi:MAG: bifunctional lysylphosphatidylglycerol flippase/synthetase MprF [Pseudonocardiaceae bacterium]